MLVDYKGNQTEYFADCVNDTINMTGGGMTGPTLIKNSLSIKR